MGLKSCLNLGHFGGLRGSRGFGNTLGCFEWGFRGKVLKGWLKKPPIF